MKPSLPRGTRDFGPIEMQQRQYLLDIIRKNFELFGFQPIETPAMENIATLTGKYGEEGDQLIYKILNSRMHEHKDKQMLLKEFELSLQTSRNSEELTEKALRYDLTIPFARFVVQNQHKLTFPFRRYQIQPVWRADKPQKGRYREFLQCDADVIGSASLTNELDLIMLIDKVFKELQVPATLKVNNRKILTALAEAIDAKEKLTVITVALDKLEKIGKEKVLFELQEKNVSASSIEKLIPVFEIDGTNWGRMEKFKKLLGNNATGEQGMTELRYLMEATEKLGLEHVQLVFDHTLARGLNYYTGTIFEVQANKGTLSSSILGGGRYDDLTGIFGLPNVSGVGISFGVDRIYDVMEELQLFPESLKKGGAATVLFSHFDLSTQAESMRLAHELRKNGIACEVYPELTKKLGKQFDYANKKNISYVCTVGSNEIESGIFPLKHMETGVQQSLNIMDMIHYIKKN
jgi:histidyl-tRNA synthetase